MKIWLICATGASATVMAALFGGYTITGDWQPAPGTFVVEEDQPGWDCSTMGNRVCGEPVYTDGFGCSEARPCPADRTYRWDPNTGTMTPA